MDSKELETATTFLYYWGNNDKNHLSRSLFLMWLQDPSDPQGSSINDNEQDKLTSI
jgi:hypothetical protein